MELYNLTPNEKELFKKDHPDMTEGEYFDQEFGELLWSDPAELDSSPSTGSESSSR
jgi:hypothetical protein